MLYVEEFGEIFILVSHNKISICFRKGWKLAKWKMSFKESVLKAFQKLAFWRTRDAILVIKRLSLVKFPLYLVCCQDSEMKKRGNKNKIAQGRRGPNMTAGLAGLGRAVLPGGPRTLLWLPLTKRVESRRPVGVEDSAAQPHTRLHSLAPLQGSAVGQSLCARPQAQGWSSRVGWGESRGWGQAQGRTNKAREGLRPVDSTAQVVMPLNS